MSNGTPTTYSELASVLADLPLLLRETRRARKLSQRGAASEIGSHFSTIRRLEQGDADCGLTTAIAILRWMDYTP